MYDEERPFVLGLDLDGVCGNYAYKLREILAKKRGVPVEELTLDISWDFKEWGLDKEEYLELHEEAIFKHHIFFNMSPIKGVSEALWELSNKDIWIRIISHRLLIHGSYQKVANDTALWLDKNNIPYRELCLVGHKTSVGADLYIEDSPIHIKEYKKLGKDVIIFSQSHNKDIEGLRADTWKEAKEIILKLASEKEDKIKNQEFPKIQ